MEEPTKNTYSTKSTYSAGIRVIQGTFENAFNIKNYLKQWLCPMCVNEILGGRGICQVCIVNSSIPFKKKPENYCKKCGGKGNLTHDDGSFREWCNKCGGTGIEKVK